MNMDKTGNLNNISNYINVKILVIVLQNVTTDETRTVLQETPLYYFSQLHVTLQLS